jgi:hypothetical protein
MAKSLWGDLTSLTVVRTPKTILEEQASVLTEATKGMLVGVVEDEPQSNGFRYTLNVVVPALNNYRYTILSIYHPLELYPLTLLTNMPIPSHMENEEAFETAVEKVLSSPDVRSALSHLKSQIG